MNQGKEEAVRDQEELMVVEEEEGEENSGADRYLLFKLGEEIYGIGIEHVIEIVEMQKITEVPDVPVFVKGVINLRGRVIPVVDLRLRFGMAERAYDDRTCMIIVGVEENALGLIVDTVAEVEDIRKEDVEPPPTFRTRSGSRQRERYISGLGKVGDAVRILVDVQRILAEDEFEAIEQQQGGVE